MAVPIKRLIEEHKLDTKNLKKYFDVDTLAGKSGDDKTKKLVSNISNSIREGIRRNRTDYRLFKAMDMAYDSPFYQVSYTQLRGLLDGKSDDKKVMEVVNSWGLTHLLPVVMKDGKECCNTDGSKQRAVNLPVFFNIFVPIVMAYIGIRWAKLFNDRNLNPFFKYEPVQFTKENRLRCEVITQVVQKMSTWFDYKADSKQTILQTLLYGFCINFPRESWFVESQEDDKGKEQRIREGLRFNIPHPSRTYYDLYHRLSSLNSNSGCEYAGYWELCRYGSIYDNDLYWNKDKITFGNMSSWFDLGRSDFLEQVFPCNMSFPNRQGFGSLDREGEAANYYSQGDFNASTLATQHFQRIIPKDCGLGSYEHPVWFRFVFANDTTVIWAEPLAFDVFPTYAYDADFNRSKFRSLALEIIPFQDHISNLLTNWISATKENLQNPIFYDAEKIPVEIMRQLENLGHKMYGSRIYIPYNSTVNYRTKTDQREAFHIPQLTHHQTGELSNLISGVLNMLDRVMQLSPQEIGQAAPHEQTAEETRVIAGNTSTRVTFTGSFIDDGDYAKKKMIYDATMAYADDEVTVGITSAWAQTEDEFKKLMDKVGLTISDDSKYDPQNPDAMHTVTAKKSAMKLESFASTRDGANRIDNPAIADAMSKIFTAVAGNPVIIQSIGPQQLIELLNQIIQTSGLPKEFKLRGSNVNSEGSPEDQAKQTQQMMQQFAEQVKQLIGQSQQETLAAAGQQSQQVAAQAVQAGNQQLAQQLAPMAQTAQQTAQASQAQAQQIAMLGKAVEELNAKIEQSKMAQAQAMLGGIPQEPALMR
jgi:hypothetical protein